MAHYQAVRPLWYPRGVAVHYVMNNRLYVRGWPSHYNDANTASQRRQRGKMAQVCQVLPHLKTLLAEGYKPRQKANGRRLGSYHVAVSTALQTWFVNTPDGPQLDLANIQLTEGHRQLPMGFSSTRQGNQLTMAWKESLRWASPKMLLAVRNVRRDEWLSCVANIEGATGFATELPSPWSSEGVEVWVAFVGNKQRSLTATRYATLAPHASASGTPRPAPPGQATAKLTPSQPHVGKLSKPRQQPIAVPHRPNCCACRFGLSDAYCTGAPGVALAERSSAAANGGKGHRAPNPNRAQLGPLRGAVGSVVYSSWLQQHYVKSKPSQRIPTAQRTPSPQQIDFAKIARCASQLLQAAKAGKLPPTHSCSAFSALIRRLYEAKGDPSRLRFSAGAYHRPHALSLQVKGRQANLAWRGPRGNPGDWLYAIIMNNDTTYAATLRVPLSAQRAVFTLPSGATADVGYAFITSADGESVGKTEFAKRE